MKIQTNFSNIPTPPVVLISNLIWGITLLVVLVSIGLGISAYRFNQDTEALQDTKLKLDERLSAMGETTANPVTNTVEFQAFRKHVAAISKLGKNKGMNPSLIMAKLEQILPNSVYLLSFQYQGETGDVILTAESKRTASLALFLRQLELEPAFNEVLLLRQLQEGQGNQKRIRYSIKFTGKL